MNMNQNHQPYPRARRIAGYTLIELVIVIVVTGILVAGASVFIVRAVQGYGDLGRRTALVEAADSALQRMARDIRLALPNSVRVTDSGAGTSFALEFLPILDAAKYNTETGANCARIKVGQGTTDFDVLGCFRNPLVTQHVGAGPTTAFRLVINNRGTSVYTDTSATSPITPQGTSISLYVNDANTALCGATAGACGTADTANYRHHITLSTSHKFGSDSPNQRLYAVSTPVSYLCDSAAGTLTRYYDYAIQPSQITTAAGFASITSSSALVSDRVSACRVLASTSDVKNRGLVTLTLSLSESDETVRLVRQVQLDNSR